MKIMIVAAFFSASAMPGQMAAQVPLGYVTAVRPGFVLTISQGHTTRVVISSRNFKCPLDRFKVFNNDRLACSNNERQAGSKYKTPKVDWLVKRLPKDIFLASIYPVNETANVPKPLYLEGGKVYKVSKNLWINRAGAAGALSTGRGKEPIYPDGRTAHSFWRTGRFIVIVEGDIKQIVAYVGDRPSKTFPRLGKFVEGAIKVSVFNVASSDSVPKSSAIHVELRLESEPSEVIYSGLVPLKDEGNVLSLDHSSRNDVVAWINFQQALWKGGFKAEAVFERLRLAAKP